MRQGVASGPPRDTKPGSTSLLREVSSQTEQREPQEVGLAPFTALLAGRAGGPERLAGGSPHDHAAIATAAGPKARASMSPADSTG
jgi:hypothetical protein